jgi:hypothetical protein
MFVVRPLVDIYMMCTKADEAWKIFDAMPEHELVTLRAIITVIGFAQNDICEAAFKYSLRFKI